MVRYLLLALALVAALAAGALGSFLLLRPSKAPLPEAPALVERVREVARLETLEVTLYKKVDFTPDPPASDSLWRNLAHWASHTLRTPRGRAIVFARAQLGFDLRRFDSSRLRVEGQRVDVALPPLEVQVELLPGETEIIGSNLDSAQTAQLLQHAKEAFHREVSADSRLRERARRSAEHSVQSLLLSLGFREVRFVEALPAPGAG